MRTNSTSGRTSHDRFLFKPSSTQLRSKDIAKKNRNSTRGEISRSHNSLELQTQLKKQDDEREKESVLASTRQKSLPKSSKSLFPF